jgi:arylformamidase
MLYGAFATQAEIDAEYNVGLLRADLPEVYRRMAQLNERALGLPQVELGLRYGPTRDEHLDIYRAAGESPRPVLVFIHGGYWRANSSRDFALAALGPLAHGLDVVVTNYSLAPRVSIGEITRQNRAAIDWVRDYDLPADVIHAGLPLSGVFDLRPLAYSYLAPALQLSRRTVET